MENQVFKTPCQCICHKQIGIVHFAPCCDNGFIVTTIKDLADDN